MYTDDTTLNSTFDSLENDLKEIQNSIVRELKKLFKWLVVSKLCLNVTKSKFMISQMPQKKLSFNIVGLYMYIDQVYEFNLLGPNR